MINFAVIGLGGRGGNYLYHISQMEDAQVAVVCDVYPDRVQEGINNTVACGRRLNKPAPKGFTDYHEAVDYPGVDAVIITTSWETHNEIAVYCMRRGIPVASEVGCEYSLESCRRLCEVHRETGTPYMFLENCCYGEEELIATSAARRGMLGKVVFCSGSYTHDLRGEVAYGIRNRHYRFNNYLHRCCDNYPTHDLGPIARLLDVNRGNRIVSVTSMASPACGLHEYIMERDDADDIMKNAAFHQADVVETLIKCENGELIRLHLQTTIPDEYTRGFTVKGTKGNYSQDLNAFFFDGDEGSDRYFKNNAANYHYLLPKIWRDVTDEQRAAGHGGMDLFIIRAFIDAIKTGSEMPIDVYDGATWMAISVLSEMSIKAGGQTQSMPDFTSGAWMLRKSKDVVEFD